MNKFVLVMGLLLLGCRVFAFDVVYPAKNDAIINSKSTFFIGSSNKPLKINGKNIPLHQTGAFAYVVDLNIGENTFILQSEDERQVFVITRPKVNPEPLKSSPFTLYNKQKLLVVTTEDAPLRSNPVDSGINRIAHLQRDVELISDGEQGGFYRIVLGDKNFGWMSKSNVKTAENNSPTLAQLFGYEFLDSKEFYTFVFYLDKKVPFEMVEGENFQIKLYNIKEQPAGTYVMNVPINDVLSTRKLLGYSGKYSGNDFILKIRKPLSTHSWRPLHNIRIAVDAGHGGYENGATGCLGDKEKDINLKIAQYLQAELKKRGAKVIMTRNGDNYVSLKDRVEIANYGDAVVFLSIHGNALPDGSNPNEHRGTSIYYYHNQAKPLADIIMDTIVSEIGVPNDKVRQGSLAVVRNTNALSLLVEVSYLINPEDNANLVNPEFQKQYAKAIADSLEKYFSN